jgi:hypothetical protein
MILERQPWILIAVHLIEQDLGMAIELLDLV